MYANASGARPALGPGRATMGVAAAADGDALFAPTHRASGEPIPIGEQLMQVDQAITLALQEIDANFAQTHQIITSRILPSIKHYGVASHNTWQGARFWHRFFETASDIHLAPQRAGAEDEWEGDHGEELDSINGEEVSKEASHSEGWLHGTRGDGSLSMAADGGEDVAFGEPGLHRTPDEDGDTSIDDIAPPRMSDASLAASARLERDSHAHALGAGDASGKGQRTGTKVRDGNDDVAHSLAQLDIRNTPGPSRKPGTSTTPRTATHSRLATDVLRSQHKTSQAAVGRVHATPRRGGQALNPFGKHASGPSGAAGAASGPSQKSGAMGRPQGEGPPLWDGIADLRRTPLAKSKLHGRKEGRGNVHSGAAGSKGAVDIDDEEDSLAWPPGMSPPVTMQFSVPRSRYTKTPAKEAARLVVDDLLRTVEGTTPATRRKLMREREQQHALEGVPEGPVSHTSVPSPAGLVGTPLRKGVQRKGRTSMPTPPTITKRMGGRQSRTSAVNLHSPSVVEHGSPVSSSARLLDKGEDGEDEEEVPAELGTGLSKVAMTQTSDSLDKLLDTSQAADDQDDDDDSDNDDTDSDEDDAVYDGAGMPGLSSGGMGGPSGGYPSSATRNGALSSRDAGSTVASLVSVSHSIDEDTLFGIREPAAMPEAKRSSASGGGGGGGSGKSAVAATTLGEAQRSRTAQAGARGSSSASASASKVRGSSGASRAPASAATARSRLSSTPGRAMSGGAKQATATTPSSSKAYQPLGRVAALGTVHRGRPLLGEGRDDTYSAPSPTPAGAGGSGASHQRRVA